MDERLGKITNYRGDILAEAPVPEVPVFHVLCLKDVASRADPDRDSVYVEKPVVFLFARPLIFGVDTVN